MSLRSGAQVEDALERLGHEVVAIDVGAGAGDAAARGAPRRRVHRAARPRRRGRHGAGAARGARASPTRARAVRACVRCADKVLAKHADARGGHAHARLRRFSETAFKSSGPARRCRIERAARLSAGRQAGAQGSALGVKFARSARSCRERSWRRCPTTARCCSSATSRAATWRCRCSTAPTAGGAGALPVVEAVPARGGLLRLRVAL